MLIAAAAVPLLLRDRLFFSPSLFYYLVAWVRLRTAGPRDYLDRHVHFAGYAKMSSATNLTNSSMGLADGAGEQSSEYYIFILPCIVLFGLCGNVISLVTILHSRLRQISANHYLLILTAADSVFLVGLTLVLFKVDFVAYEFCVIIEYILMTSSYVSSWSIAALTIERYIAIAHPLRHVRWADVDRLRIILYWIPIPFILNLIQFISLIPYDDKSDPNYPHIRKCVPYNGRLQVIAETADILLCFVIPCLIVVVLNLIIAAKVRRADRGFQQTATSEHGSGIQARTSRRQTGRGRAPSASSSTRILLVVPIVYIVLNTPFYLIRMAETILLNVFKSKDLSIQGGLQGSFIITLYNGAHYLYFVNFASDVIVYAFSSANFRKTAVIAWKRILWPSYDGQVNKTQTNKFSYKYSSTSLNHENRSSYTNLRGALISNGHLSPKGSATAAL
ncbi:hypothetical protein QR680_006997 [Steinernema hermaphroditum]|uniref:G-protein coupled receptors family 1 profile domain-containing protein n=1 Tax=Steinernema hermaphroditum TaxID=289476 RepID=A0AA39LYB2_9BILA|nr:hypothetical protein QR680_006997 [Steinernema hermaphroditum]